MFPNGLYIGRVEGLITSAKRFGRIAYRWHTRATDWPPDSSNFVCMTASNRCTGRVWIASARYLALARFHIADSLWKF